MIERTILFKQKGVFTIEKIALNYALMIEIMRSQGASNVHMVDLLKSGDPSLLDKYGSGIPDWQTLIDYYQNNQQQLENAIFHGYEIRFLTKGALKNLLKYKYGLLENEDFQDCGEYLDEITISTEKLISLRATIAKNWTIIEKEVTGNENELKIELTYKPKF